MPKITKSIMAGSQGFVTSLRGYPNLNRALRVVCYGAFAPFKLKHWPSLSPYFQIFHTPRNLHPLDRFDLLMGTYEKDERDVLAQLKPANVIIELGANIGIVSSIAFGKLREGGHYICVEPNPNSQEALAANMRATQRRFPGRAFSIISAVLCEPEKDRRESDFVVRRGMSSGDPSHLRVHEGEKSIKLPARSLSSLVKEYATRDKGDVTLVCDIEGAEIALSKRPEEFVGVSQIALELHQPKLTGQFDEPPEKVLNRFIAMGFRPVMSNATRSCYLLVRDPA